MEYNIFVLKIIDAFGAGIVYSSLIPEWTMAYWRRIAMSIRSLLYAIARLMGDVNAVQKGRVGKRIGRRVAGRAVGKGMGRLFR